MRIDPASRTGRTFEGRCGSATFGSTAATSSDAILTGDTVHGVELLAWDAPGARWESLASADYAPESPGELGWDGMGAEAAVRLRQRDGTLHFAVRPLAGDGNGPTRPQLVLDWIEARVHYRWPIEE